jgi:membrane protein implicated in regulation of membrane protease activity
MAEPAEPASGPSPTSPLWIAVGVLLLIGIIVPLLVGVYDQHDPTLWGFPFFYWFQFLLIPIVSLLTFTAYKLSQRATDRDRRAAKLDSGAGEQR